ncbi:MAG TPA: NAD(P)-dependent oxidoreductase [Drouetiella sp.]
MVANGVRKKVLVTGASGLIGRAVTERLLIENAYDVKVQVRNPSQARSEVGNIIDFTRVQMEEADFTRVGDREMRLLTKGCDIIVHSAGLVHQPDAPYQEYEVINVRATQLLAEAAAQNNVKTLVFLSSSAVYGPGPFDRIAEAGPLKAVTPYAVSKMTSENWLQQFQGIPKVVILRPSLVFGEGDRGNLISLMRNIKENKYKHIGNADTAKSMIYSKDLARAISLCINNLPDGVHIFNVANPEPVPVRTLADACARVLNAKKISSVPEGVFRIGVKAAELFMQDKSPITMDQVNKLTTTTTTSIGKLVSATGFQPKTPLDDALAAEVEWANRYNLL